MLDIFLYGALLLVVLDFIYLNWDVTRVTIRWPLLGDLPVVLSHFDDVFEFVAGLYIPRKLKPMSLYLGRDRTIFVAHPLDIQHILKTNYKNYTISNGMRGDSLKDLLGDGIFAADGESWSHQRKTVSREFTQNNFRTFMLHEFSHYARILKGQLQHAAKTGATVDMHSLFFRLTLDSFGKVGFGVDLGGLENKPVPFAAAFDDAQVCSTERMVKKVPPLWKFQRAFNLGSEGRLKKDLAVINDFVEELAGTRREERKKEEKSAALTGSVASHHDPEDTDAQDLFHRLFAISEADKTMSKEQQSKYLRDMTVNFMIAGRDTTACALSWIVYELCKNPEAEKRLAAEIHDCVPIADKLSYDDLADCHYLSAVIHEGLRLHPSVPHDPKHCNAADTLPHSGIKVNAGDNVAYIPYTMGRLTELWGANAAEFTPERWLSDYDPTNPSGASALGIKKSGKESPGPAPTFVKCNDMYKFAVFQAGPRVCLGVDMALLEMKAVLVALYSSVTFKLQAEPKVKTTLVLQMQEPGLQTKVELRK